MTFQPIVPMSGYVGWRFLQNTLESQQATFNQSQSVARETDYFREKIATIQTAEELVSDRRLLGVALGAFGLDEDIDNRFFIQKVLSEGTADDEALASRLSDSRYATLSDTFGFGETGLPRTGLAFFADAIINRFEVKQFERAVGEQNNDLRAALNLEAGLQGVLSATSGADARWFSVMGDPPLRRVFEYALGLPSSIAGLDLDLQLEQFQSRAQAVFGTRDVSDFTDPEQQEKMIRLFLIRSEAEQVGSFGSGSVALSLLQSSQINYPSLY